MSVEEDRIYKECCNQDDVESVNTCEEKMEKREELMKKIKALDFSIIELGLYLDTHPNDRRALCLHREYANEVKDLKDKYQRKYGPLTINYPCNKWRWIEEPWPWEGSDR